MLQPVTPDPVSDPQPPADRADDVVDGVIVHDEVPYPECSCDPFVPGEPCTAFDFG